MLAFIHYEFIRDAALVQDAHRLQLQCLQSIMQEQQHVLSLEQPYKLQTTILLPMLALLFEKMPGIVLHCSDMPC